MWRMYDDADVHASRHEPCVLIYVLSWNVEREHSECMWCAWYFLISKHSVSVPLGEEACRAVNEEKLYEERRRPATTNL